MAFSWICPYCNQNANITNNNRSSQIHRFSNGNQMGQLNLLTEIIICPNPKCSEFSISAELQQIVDIFSEDQFEPEVKKVLSWQLKPNTFAKQFPNYIPKSVLDDYKEACLIRDLSPKASATLARRCLQGMIRDYWSESKNTLNEEIKAIKDRIDPITWQAIDAVRKIGNIGAHMEKDINLIIDVEPNEAQMLIGLIEMLLKEWYIARYERQKQLEDLIGLDAIKSEQKNTPKLVNK